MRCKIILHCVTVGRLLFPWSNIRNVKGRKVKFRSPKKNMQRSPKHMTSDKPTVEILKREYFWNSPFYNWLDTFAGLSRWVTRFTRDEQYALLGKLTQWQPISCVRVTLLPGYPLHRENRENGQKKSLSGKTHAGNLEILPKHKTVTAIGISQEVRLDYEMVY